jgi:nucleoside recognition membrane protein YjiH
MAKGLLAVRRERVGKMYQVTILVPFGVAALLCIAAAEAASMAFSYFLVTVVMNRITEPVFQLPGGVAAACSFRGCEKAATRGTREVVEALERRREYRYLPGEKPAVYCEQHRPRFADRHRITRILATAVVWVCLVWGGLAHFQPR